MQKCCTGRLRMLLLKSDFSKSSCSSRCAAPEFETCRVALGPNRVPRNRK